MNTTADPKDHLLDDHLEDAGPRGGSSGGFYARLDDGGLIEHIPDGQAYEVRIETGDVHPRGRLESYAKALTAHYRELQSS
jgi:hypothetical protein